MSTPAMYERKLAEIAALEARLTEAIAERDSIRTMLLNERAEWMDEAIRRQASVNQNLAALVTDAQEELRKCQQDAIQLQAQLAEAEAERDTWQACALMAGEYCGETAGPTGYYEFTPMQFKLWFRDTVAYKRPSRLAEAEALLRMARTDELDLGGGNFKTIRATLDRIDAFLAAADRENEGL